MHRLFFCLNLLWYHSTIYWSFWCANIEFTFLNLFQGISFFFYFTMKDLIGKEFQNLWNAFENEKSKLTISIRSIPIS